MDSNSSWRVDELVRNCRPHAYSTAVMEKPPVSLRLLTPEGLLANGEGSAKAGPFFSSTEAVH